MTYQGNHAPGTTNYHGSDSGTQDYSQLDPSDASKDANAPDYEAMQQYENKTSEDYEGKSQYEANKKQEDNCGLGVPALNNVGVA